LRGKRKKKKKKKKKEERRRRKETLYIPEMDQSQDRINKLKSFIH